MVPRVEEFQNWSTTTIEPYDCQGRSSQCYIIYWDSDPDKSWKASQLAASHHEPGFESWTQWKTSASINKARKLISTYTWTMKNKSIWSQPDSAHNEYKSCVMSIHCIYKPCNTDYAKSIRRQKSIPVKFLSIVCNLICFNFKLQKRKVKLQGWSFFSEKPSLLLLLHCDPENCFFIQHLLHIAMLTATDGANILFVISIT